MMIAERIQALIHKLEISGASRLNYVALAVAVFSLAVWYDLHCYHNFNNSEAMDAAQVARNVAAGKGFSTEFIRPFSVYLMQKHNRALIANATPGNNGTNIVDYAQIYGLHPDLANAPLYPLILAGLFKIHTPDWRVEMHKTFWTEGGRFARYLPDLLVTIFNQILLLVVVLLTFLVARKVLDTPAAWLSALLVLGSDQLWRFSVSGLPMMLLLVIFLGLSWCLATFEIENRAETTGSRRQFYLAMAAGLLTGLGMMTRYSFGWVICTVVAYFAAFGGARRTGLAVAAFLVFAASVLPWIVRNWAVSGTLFGTAGYAVVEGSLAFPGSKLMQSLNPNMTSAYWIYPYLVKLQFNLRQMLQSEMLRLGGGWMGILFLAGLLLGLRNSAARRLRIFTMLCLGLFLVVSALGRTSLSDLSPEINTENLLMLLTPMVMIFGVAFFLTLLNQMNTPSLQVRYAVVALVAALACEPFVMALFPPRISPSAYPPYYPPDLQRFAGWLGTDELMMSDVPWAMAWYGDRQCVWTTINSNYEFFQFHNYVKHVSGLYLSLQSVDAKLFSECLCGPLDSWGNFIFERVGAEKIKRPDAVDVWGNIVFKNLDAHKATETFPLQVKPTDVYTGLFLTDRIRWRTE